MQLSKQGDSILLNKYNALHNVKMDEAFTQNKRVAALIEANVISITPIYEEPTVRRKRKSRSTTADDGEGGESTTEQDTELEQQ